VKAIFLAFCTLIAPAFAFECNVDYLQKTHLVQLQSLQDSSIRMVEGEKYYLDPNKVSISDSGIHLHTDYFAPLALQRLFQDQDGVFVLSRYYQHRCKNCGAVYDTQPSECSVCKGTSFEPYGVD